MMKLPNAFDWAQVISSLTISFVVALVGWWINRSIKKLEHSNWANQKLIEKRLILFDQIAPKLNKIYCFALFIGEWKETSPVEIIQIKRELDKIMHIYKVILGENVFQAYRTLIASLFSEYKNVGADAAIKIKISSEFGDRRIHCTTWQAEWEQRFDEKNAPCFKNIKSLYEACLHEFQIMIGIAPPA